MYVMFEVHIKITNCNNITSTILQLTKELNTWSSKVCIPIADSVERLDISCATQEDNSTTPPGAVNQPSTYPTLKGIASVYRFNPNIYGEDSWDDLYNMLKESLSGCQLSIRQVQQAITTRKVSYTLACDQSRVYESRSAIDFHDEYVGPLNVINERMKRKKTY